MGKTQTNKMGVMPVKKLIINMSFPIMVSMLVQALYNVVDSIFVAQLGENALSAVTIAFPLQNLVIAVGAGTGVGTNAILSKSLGEKNFKRASKTAINSILLAIVNSIIFFVIGLTLSHAFIITQTTNPDIISSGTAYITIVTALSVGVFFQITFERLLQSTGRTVLSMVTQLSGAILNIILDPIMIFGYFGFPRMGVAGAALATVCGQFMGCAMGFYLNHKWNHEIDLDLKQVFHPDFKIIKLIYYIGIPSILMMSIGSLMTYLLNLILMGFSVTATAVFGIYYKLQSFFFMPVFGLNNGLIPVLAYNYGARNKNRIDEALRFSAILAFVLMLVGTILFEAIPTIFLQMFHASDKMLELGVKSLRIIAIHFPLAGIGIILGSTFQAFGKSFYSLFVALGRQLIILIPVAYFMSLTGNVNNVWWSFFIAEIISLILSILFFKKLYREDVEPLNNDKYIV